jgi:hypothetical protein
LSTYRNSKECCNNERLYLFKRRGGLSAFRAGGWREAKMGDIHGLAQWPEILAFAGSQVLADQTFLVLFGAMPKRTIENKFETEVTDFFSNLQLIR